MLVSKPIIPEARQLVMNKLTSSLQHKRKSSANASFPEKFVDKLSLVRVAGVAVVVFEERGDLLLDEEFGSNKALLLEEPDEEQAGDEPDDMLLRTEGSGADLWESGLLAGALEPSKEFAIEALVEFLSVQRGQPCVKESVKVAGLAVVAHPAEAGVQRKRGENVQGSAVRIARINFSYQKHSSKHIALRLALIGTAINKGQREEFVLVKEENDGGDAKASVKDADEQGVLTTRIRSLFERHSQEKKTSMKALLGKTLPPPRISSSANWKTKPTKLACLNNSRSPEVSGFPSQAIPLSKPPLLPSQTRSLSYPITPRSLRTPTEKLTPLILARATSMRPTSSRFSQR